MNVTALGALTVSASTEVTGIDVENGRVRRVHTDKGPIETEYIFVCCGVWSPRIAKMAGAAIPLTPAVHQMISVGPIPLFEETPGEIFFPIVRDVDTNMYERQNGSDMEVGSYAHRSILMDPDEIPSIEESALSPTELPFTSEDFDLQLEQALELMPEILTVEGAGIRHAINGLLSLTPDGMPILGETPEVKNLWSVAAVWIKEGPGIARAVAEWVVEGASEIDVHGADIARFHPHQREQRHVDARASEGFNKTYGIVHPMEQWESNRNVRVSPFHPREQELGAVFFETACWERPRWYESNAVLLEEYGDRVMPREAEWESRWWSPIVNAEHLAMRDRVAMIDLTAFHIFDVTGPPREAGYISFIPDSSGTVIVKRKWFTDNFPRRRETRWRGISIPITIDSFENYTRSHVSGDIRFLGSFRRTRVDSTCEFTRTGNIYGFMVDWCRPLDRPDAPHLYQVEVEYLHSRTRDKAARDVVGGRQSVRGVFAKRDGLE